MWQYRELIYILAWRDVKVRYKQTLLGAAWAVLQPGLMMVVFTIFFGRLAHVSSGGVDYSVFVYAGLLPWTFFATAITSAGNSVVGSERLITKVYFPRLAVPFASVGAAVVDSFIACGLLLVLMLCNGIVPDARSAAGSVVHGDHLVGGGRRRHAAGRSQRRLSRFPLCDTVFDAILDVRHPDGVHAAGWKMLRRVCAFS